MKYRVTVSAAGTGYLVHVEGKAEPDAIRRAIAKIAKEIGGVDLSAIKVRKVERIEECAFAI